MLLTLEKKKIFSNHVLNLCTKHSYIVIVEYSNLSASKMDDLRKLCRTLDTIVRAVKNTTTVKALHGTRYDNICVYLKKPSLFFFTNKDVAILVKKINDLYIKSRNIQFKCFYLDGNVYNKEFTDKIMFLPSIEYALCKFFFVLKVLLLNLVCLLREFCVKFIKVLWCIKFKQDTKELN